MKRNLHDVFMDWWNSAKVTAIIAACVLTIWAGLSLDYWKDHKRLALADQVLKIKSMEIEARAADQARRAQDAQMLASHAMENEKWRIDQSVEVENRALQVQQQAEERQRKELEYRAIASAQVLDMQRKDREMRHQRLEREHRLRERELEIQRGREIADKERRELLALLISDRRYAEAVGYARTPGEIEQLSQLQRQQVLDQERRLRQMALDQERQQRQRHLDQQRWQQRSTFSR